MLRVQLRQGYSRVKGTAALLKVQQRCGYSRAQGTSGQGYSRDIKGTAALLRVQPFSFFLSFFLEQRWIGEVLVRFKPERMAAEMELDWSSMDG